MSLYSLLLHNLFLMWIAGNTLSGNISPKISLKIVSSPPITHHFGITIAASYAVSTTILEGRLPSLEEKNRNKSDFVALVREDADIARTLAQLVQSD
ncbi:hypothetical protein HOY80DRAFT_231517 [Tuber brumale]|nr:hypothetical protein HOY80DRAFT_231517 [Tuber brumale]